MCCMRELEEKLSQAHWAHLDEVRLYATLWMWLWMQRRERTTVAFGGLPASHHGPNCDNW